MTKTEHKTINKTKKDLRDRRSSMLYHFSKVEKTLSKEDGVEIWLDQSLVQVYPKRMIGSLIWTQLIATSHKLVDSIATHPSIS